MRIRAVVAALLISSAILALGWWVRQFGKTPAPAGRDVTGVEARQSAGTSLTPAQPAVPESNSSLKPSAAQPSEPKEHSFRGTVEKVDRSEERRVGKECRSRRWTSHSKKRREWGGRGWRADSASTRRRRRGACASAWKCRCA